MLSGARYSPGDIARILAELDAEPGCVGDRSRDVAVISLYIGARAELAGSSAGLVPLNEAKTKVRQALACSPNEGFLWYALFWAEMSSGTERERYLKFLEKSYRLAPNEAWISVYRFKDALPHLAFANEVVRDSIRAEFYHMLRDTPAVAAAILKDAADSDLSILRGWLSSVPLTNRQQLAQLLDDIGALVDVPGVAYSNGAAVPEKQSSARRQSASGHRPDTHERQAKGEASKTTLEIRPGIEEFVLGLELRGTTGN
jgi:hypothetical protein